jgi:hypothetical protein
VDPTGEFSRQRRRKLFLWYETTDSASIIRSHLDYVSRESRKITERLKVASEVQQGDFSFVFVLLSPTLLKGMEILQLFILDLMGR